MNEPRHPTLPVADLDAAGRFYRHVLGCRTTVPGRHPAAREATGETGRADAAMPRLDLELFGQPLSLQRCVDGAAGGAELALVLGVDDWCTLSERLREHDVAHEVETARRFSVAPGEQCAIRFEDPDGNAVELRGFAAEATQLAA